MWSQGHPANTRRKRGGERLKSDTHLWLSGVRKGTTTYPRRQLEVRTRHKFLLNKRWK